MVPDRDTDLPCPTLKESDYDLRTLIDGVEAPTTAFSEYRAEVNNPIPLIYQSGYLTIKEFDKEFKLYRLSSPTMKYVTVS